MGTGPDKFTALRRRMVAGQLAARGIKDERVLAAMEKVPRHLFTAPEYAEMAYDDMALPLGDGQTISQPYMVAVMTELLALRGGEKVLEVGTGSGYQAAVLAELAAEVYTVEYRPELAERAKRKLDGLGYGNIRSMAADGSAGWPEGAPYQGILVTAAAPDVPPPLIEQLDEGGRLVIPLGSRGSQRLLMAVKRQGRLVKEYHTFCVFVPLLGQYGWPDSGE
ncbi:MAG: protein-L-isoaspartate(D-aspartate) O-methyltransferase [Nitrospiraceae bacterium]|nr:protein-L-isoaspartate(D-aspartate) O-methyltransferase [Nitrospiraceae bacterium]